MKRCDLKFILEAGEGQFVEFKESADKSLAKEITAFANASGGNIYLGIADKGMVKEIDIKRSESRNRLMADLLSRIDYKKGRNRHKENQRSLLCKRKSG